MGYYSKLFRTLENVPPEKLTADVIKFVHDEYTRFLKQIANQLAQYITSTNFDNKTLLDIIVNDLKIPQERLNDYASIYTLVSGYQLPANVADILNKLTLGEETETTLSLKAFANNEPPSEQEIRKFSSFNINPTDLLTIFDFFNILSEFATGKQIAGDNDFSNQEFADFMFLKLLNALVMQGKINEYIKMVQQIMGIRGPDRSKLH